MNSIVVLIGILVTLVTGAPVVIQLRRDHPKGLVILFFAEMWERFSYYGMRALLVFYLTQQFLFDDRAATAAYGSYATLVYLAPLVGGVLADRVLGARKAVAFGALLLVAGHLTMAIEGPPARQTLAYAGGHYDVLSTGRGDEHRARLQVGGHAYDFDQAADGAFQIKNLPRGAPLPETLAKGTFTLRTQAAPVVYRDIMFLALALIIGGVGFLKSNISTIVGQLYAQGDPKRDPAFTLFYYGINLGAFWAAILCGYLGTTYGWAYGFGLAGLGMLAGFATFVVGRPLLLGKGEPPDPVVLAKRQFGPLSLEHLIYAAAVPGVALIWVLVQSSGLVGWALAIGAAASLGYVVWHLITRCDRIARERMFLAFVLIAGSVVFFTLFEQAGTSLSLYAERNTDLALITHPANFAVLGHPVFLGTRTMWEAAGRAPGALWIDMGFDAAQTQSFNAGFILIFAPLLAALWTALGRRGRNPNPVIKFGLGLAQVGLGFLVIVWSQGLADPGFRLPLIVLAGVYLLHTTGELCLSPVGLSEITKLAPSVLVSTVMAVWFLATAAAEFIGARIAGLTGAETVGGQVVNPAAAFHATLHVFGEIGWAAVAIGGVFLALSPVLKAWAHPAPAPD